MAKDVEMKDKGMRNLLQALSGKIPQARVGILGDKASRSGPLNNAAIGTIHEFGAPERNIPMRSFLRMPITTKFDKAVKKKKGLDEATLIKVVQTKSLLPFVQKLGVVGEEVVALAFASGGFGQWEAHAPGYTNNTGDLLVDSTDLRDSIASDTNG